MVEEEKSPLSVSLVTFGFDLIVPLVFSNRHEVSARKKHIRKHVRAWLRNIWKGWTQENKFSYIDLHKAKRHSCSVWASNSRGQTLRWTRAAKDLISVSQMKLQSTLARIVQRSYSHPHQMKETPPPLIKTINLMILRHLCFFLQGVFDVWELWNPALFISLPRCAHAACETWE